MIGLVHYIIYTMDYRTMIWRIIGMDVVLMQRFYEHVYRYVIRFQSRPIKDALTPTATGLYGKGTKRMKSDCRYMIEKDSITKYLTLIWRFHLSYQNVFCKYCI